MAVHQDLLEQALIGQMASPGSEHCCASPGLLLLLRQLAFCSTLPVSVSGQLWCNPPPVEMASPLSLVFLRATLLGGHGANPWSHRPGLEQTLAKRLYFYFIFFLQNFIKMLVHRFSLWLRNVNFHNFFCKVFCFASKPPRWRGFFGREG